MKKPNETELLDQMIWSLKTKKEFEFDLLKDQFHETYENLKPLNLIKSTFADLTDSPNIKHNIINTIIGFSTGYISRKFFVGNTHNPIKKVLGSILQFAITNVVSKR